MNMGHLQAMAVRCDDRDIKPVTNLVSTHEEMNVVGDNLNPAYDKNGNIKRATVSERALHIDVRSGGAGKE